MIKMVSLKCPDCGANLSIEEDRKQCFCQYCGSKILIDDGSRTYTHVYIDRTREKEIELEEKKLVAELEREKSNAKWKIFSIASVVISVILAIIGYTLVKEDFNISFNYLIFLVGSIIAITRVVKKETMFGLFFVSLIFSCACLMFISCRKDFDATFTVTLLMAILLNIVASFIKSKRK